MLYGAESWILNTTLLIKLESFQAEIGKRILRLPKFVANNTVRMALQWPSVRTRVLCIKLGFLLKVLNNENSLSARVFHSLAVSDVEALHLIRQCRFLESSLNTNFTSRILSSHQECSFSQLKKEIIEVDFSLLMPCSQLLVCSWWRLPLLTLSSWSHNFIYHSRTVCWLSGKLLRRDLLLWQNPKSDL